MLLAPMVVEFEVELVLVLAQPVQAQGRLVLPQLAQLALALRPAQLN
jgi:hypothetical protein